MESIFNIYKIGRGPSSSHTMGPAKAATVFKEKFPSAGSFRVTLYGSLAATGKGHLTDVAIIESLKPVFVEIIWKRDVFMTFHPNAMKLEAIDKDGKEIGSSLIYSIGGGNIVEEGRKDEQKQVYQLVKMKDILQWCETNGKTIWEFIETNEDLSLWDHLAEVWQVMKSAVERGIEKEGSLPGGLNLHRKASSYYIKAQGFKASLKSKALVFSYALAVAEENAAGGEIVTAPTCGSCGVVPAVLYHLHKSHKFTEDKIVKALATAGIIGNLVKTNASISGAEVGCQGEIGTACSMAAAAATQLFGGTPSQIEYAAEMGLEHHLGLTCDPVKGIVQIPCIERNAFAASRALDANLYSMLSDGRHLVTFDRVVSVLQKTGHDIPNLYKETGEGGLAAITL